MWWGYRAMGKAVGAGARAGTRLGGGIGAGLATQAAQRPSRRLVRHGYLAPGDPPPPPTASGYLDYRGTADWRELRGLEGGAFSLGAFADLRAGRPRGPIGLPEQLLNRHAAIVGPAGSGKTHGLVVPWIVDALAAGWSVVAVDVKGDLLRLVKECKAARGGPPLGARISVWDFMDPQRSARWEWVAELHDDARLDAAVTAIIGRRSQSAGSDPYFHQRDYRTLRGLLAFVHAAGPRVRSAHDLAQLLQDDVRLSRAVARLPRAPGVSDLQAVLRFPPADHAKVVSGVTTALSAFDVAGANTITRADPARPQLDLDRTLDSHQLLIVGAALRGGQVAETLSSLLLNQLAQRFYERFDRGGRPVLLVIDEAPRIAGRVDVAQLLEVSRSAGVGVVLAMQDVAQISDENERSSILSNAATCALLPGASPRSAEELGRRLGQRTESTVSLSVGGPNAGAWAPPASSRNLGSTTVPVLGDREIMQPPVPGRPAVVHVKAPELGITGKPFLVELSRP